MTFYGSSFSNETSLNGGQPRPARHIACPQRLKYIHDIKDGYIPYVEDSPSTNQSSYKNGPKNRLRLYNTADTWRQELMGLAQQVQSSLVPTDESQHSRLSRSRHQYAKRSRSSISTYYPVEKDEQNISKRLLNRRASARYPRSQLTKSRISNDKNNEQESSVNNENQDAGIWLLPILCHVLQNDNILEAQDWLMNANPTEKRLAMELISRTMQDMQNTDNDFISDTSTGDQSSTLNNVYWPYKLWQRQQQSKVTSYPSSSIENNDKCERATSPLRLLTPARRSSTRNANDRATSSILIRTDQSLQTGLPDDSIKIRQSSSRMSTPMTANSSGRLSRRSYHVVTSRSTSVDGDHIPMSAKLRGKTPLI